MRNRLNIIVVAGLAINLIAGASHAANQNPWAMYGGQKGGNTGTVRPRMPQQPQQFGQQAPQQAAPQQAAPRQFNYQYAPLPGEQKSAAPSQQQPYGQYQQPYGNTFGFGFQMPTPFTGQNFGQGYGQGYGQGNLGGLFGFGMNFAPNFGGSGMPFGFGVPAMPFSGPFPGPFYGGANNYGVPNQGQFGNPYGNPYGSPYGNPNRGINPWGMGFPMF